MSDPRDNVGAPVEEPANVDDVVGQAHEGLAAAEAAGSDAVGDSADAQEPAVAAQTQDAAQEVSAAEPSAAMQESAGDDGDGPFSSPALNALHAAEAAQAPAGLHEPEQAAAAPADVAAPVADAAPAPQPEADPEPAPVATAAEAAPTAAAAGVGAAGVGAASVGAAGVGAAVAAAEAAPVQYAPQPIFVQAPEEPRPRGNRAAAGAIGLLAALSFAALYLGVALLVNLAAGQLTVADLGTSALAALSTWSLWVPTVVFFIAFWLLGAIINRGRWGAWVIFGVFVGLAAYGGHLLGVLFNAPFWMISAEQGAQLVQQELFGPFAIAAFVIGRELTIWFGAWVAARGRKMNELNVEARREYERTLEAGPQLAR